MLGGSRRRKSILINEEINHKKKNETSLRIVQDPRSFYKSALTAASILLCMPISFNLFFSCPS